MITHIQIRAGRAMINWSQDQLATAASISKRTLAGIEAGGNAPRTETLTALQAALEAQGVEFLPGNGVRPKEEMITVYEGADAEEQLLNDIYQTMVAMDEGDREILIYGLDEVSQKENPEAYALAKAQLERITKAGIKERIIGREGNENFIAPWHYYRWVPAKEKFKTPLFCYGSKIALNHEMPPYKSIVIENELFAGTFKHLFNHAWDRAMIPPQPKG